MRKVELLAPAGSLEALAAAVESGADAVYLGGSKYNARAYADNFDNDALIKAVDYAHLRGVKVYITVNILFSDKELEEVLDYIRFLYHIGVDAVIVQDSALIKLVKSLFPGLEVHCSTQMTIHNSAGVEFYAGLGADRIVLARELSIKEVTRIIEKTGMDVEIFIHGALCVSYSGQCLMSSMIGGRSGNRGRCAQPCRKIYSFYDVVSNSIVDEKRGKHLLSTRDLNTYMKLEEVLKSGVRSLKIEGRMKKPEYVAIVVKNYREAIDNILRGEKDYHSNNASYELESAFNREFTEGYLFNNRNKEIVSIDRPDNRGIYLGRLVKQQGNIASIRIENGILNDGDGIEIIDSKGKSKGSLISGIRVKGQNVRTAVYGNTAEVFMREKAEAGAKVNKTYDSVLNKKAKEEYARENIRKVHVNCRIFAKIGEKPVIQIWDSDGNHVSYKADESIEKAQKAATSQDRTIEQLKKTGDTPYVIESVEMNIDEDCYLPARLVNHLRREVLSLLSKARTERYKRKKPQFDSRVEIEKVIEKKAVYENEEVESIAGIIDIRSAVSAVKAGVDTIYIMSEAYRGDIGRDLDTIKDMCSREGAGLYYVMPSITKDSELKMIERQIMNLKEKSNPLELGLVISNAGQFSTAAKLGIKKLRINYTFNVFNSVTLSQLLSMGAESVCVSPELKLTQINKIASKCGMPLEALVYGRIPVMTTEYCPVSLLKKNCLYSDDCRESKYDIIDDKGKKFRIIKLNSCRTKLLNSDVLFVAEDLERIIENGVKRLRLNFYTESPEEVFEIVSLYKRYPNIGDAENKLIQRIKNTGFTRGHFFRGIE